MTDMPPSGAYSLAGRHGLRLMDAKTRALLSGVRTEDGRPRGFLHATVFFTPLLYALTDCFLRWGFLSINFMAKSAMCLNYGPRPKKKQFQSTPHTYTHTHTHTHTNTHTFSNSPRSPSRLIQEGHCFS